MGQTGEGFFWRPGRVSWSLLCFVAGVLALRPCATGAAYFAQRKYYLEEDKKNRPERKQWAIVLGARVYRPRGLFLFFYFVAREGCFAFVMSL